MGWLLYSWDLDKGSGQGVVKAVVLEVKDLSRSWMSFRAADKCKKLHGGFAGAAGLFLIFHFKQASVGHLIVCWPNHHYREKNWQQDGF